MAVPRDAVARGEMGIPGGRKAAGAFHPHNPLSRAGILGYACAYPFSSDGATGPHSPMVASRSNRRVSPPPLPRLSESQAEWLGDVITHAGAAINLSGQAIGAILRCVMPDHYADPQPGDPNLPDPKTILERAAEEMAAREGSQRTMPNGYQPGEDDDEY